MTRHLLALFLFAVSLPSCRSQESELAAPDSPRIESSWDPSTGRGFIRVFHPGGQVSDIKLHQGYGAYTGGLVLGSQDGSAWCRRRVDERGGAGCTALWCAQDESIWLPERGLEYTYGWSENMGTGGDGVPLRYLGGAVLAESPDELLLTSEHGAMPLHVTRWLRVRADGTLLFRVRVLNVDDQPVTLDLWSGEDPWVGTYGSARGDIGWLPGGFVLEERSVLPREAACLGIADRGAADGSGEPVANSFCLSPATPEPDRIYFANRFAHTEYLHRRIWFPFAVDDQHPYPHEVVVASVRDRDRLKDGVVFPLEVPAGGDLVHEVTYRQRTLDGSATYIVTSARGWNEPLDSAELVVVAPSDVEVTSVSYPMSGPDDSAGASVWSTTIERFFPDREFTVTWEKRARDSSGP